MIEFLTANIAELMIGLLITAVSGLWATLSAIKSKFQSDMLERKKLWDEQMIHINHAFEELLTDHRDIKRDLSGLKEELGHKVEKIMTDHASHERDQAVQLEMLRDIKNKAEQKRGLFG